MRAEITDWLEMEVTAIKAVSKHLVLGGTSIV